METVTVAILAGGNSKRFGSEKAIAEYRGRPLVAHMVDIARRLSREVMIVVSDETQVEILRNIVPDIQIVVDPPGE
ncbi:MAG: molybdenum cofactor guanylyltransferase, partial [Candidatus Thorarchaeota archaeon]